MLPEDSEATRFRLWRTAGTNDVRLIGTLTAASAYSAMIVVNDRTLLERSGQGATRLWDIADPARPVPGAALNDLQRLAGGHEVATDGRIVATNGVDGFVHLWDVDDPDAPIPLSTIPRPASSGGLIMSRDGDTLFVVDESDGVHIWDVTNPRRPIEASRLSAGEPLRQLSVQSDGGTGNHKSLAISTTTVNPHEILLWDINDAGKPVHEKMPPTVDYDFTISNDGRTLVVATANTVDLWDISDVRHPARVTRLPTTAQAELTFSPDDRLLVSTTRSRSTPSSSARTEPCSWSARTTAPAMAPPACSTSTSTTSPNSCAT